MKERERLKLSAVCQVHDILYYILVLGGKSIFQYEGTDVSNNWTEIKIN